MKQITPYKALNEALLSLDNGGRFYNILTKSNDGVISPAELGKIGGIFNDKQKAILFLEMSMMLLNDEEQQLIISKLDESLKETYLKYKSQNLLPSEANEKGMVAANAILTGVPKLIDEKSNFNGFIMVPIMAGKVMTFVMIPIIDSYSVYELRDEETSKTFIIAHAKGSQKLPNKKIKIGGVLKEFKSGKSEGSSSVKFLETNYYISS